MLLLTRQEAQPARLLAAARELAGATGAQGMVAGQYIDVAGTAPTARPGLRRLHELKTGRLIAASVECVLLLAGLDEPERIHSFTGFARELGVLFQIVDDILDVTGSAGDAGQAPGQRRATRQADVRDRVRARRRPRARRRSRTRRASAALAQARARRDPARELEQITDFIATRSF